jgi:hypothetical protein
MIPFNRRGTLANFRPPFSRSPFAAARKKAPETSHSSAKKPLNSSAFKDSPGTAAVIGAVAMRVPTATCMTATPTMVRAMPAGRNQAANQPTPTARITMKKPIPLPSSRTIVVHTVRNAATVATTIPARYAPLPLGMSRPAASFDPAIASLPPRLRSSHRTGRDRRPEQKLSNDQAMLSYRRASVLHAASWSPPTFLNQFAATSHRVVSVNIREHS